MLHASAKKITPYYHGYGSNKFKGSNYFTTKTLTVNTLQGV